MITNNYLYNKELLHKTGLDSSREFRYIPLTIEGKKRGIE